MLKPPHATCKICKHIPDFKQVEILHGQDRLPPQVEQLQVLGGNPLYGGPPEIRKCEVCGTFYTFLHDHDSESGVGYGYTDEAIKRISAAEALTLMPKSLAFTDRMIAYYEKKILESKMPHYRQQLERRRLEKRLLEAEIARLSAAESETPETGADSDDIYYNPFGPAGTE